MIQVRYRGDGTAGPIVACDVCGDRIAKVDEGVALFPKMDRPNTKVDVQHVHKGVCSEQAVNEMNGAGSMDLGQHLLLLSVNTCVDADAFINLAKEAMAQRQKGTPSD